MDVGSIKALFDSLKEENRGIAELLLISDDGFPLVSTLETGDREVCSTAVGAILCDAGQRGIRELDLGELEAVITLGSGGYFVLTRIAPGTLFMTLASEEASLGLVLLRVKQARTVILEAMERG